MVQHTAANSKNLNKERFSILWRISCGATPLPRIFVNASVCFSILWRISCGATNCDMPPEKSPAGVSVFSGESRVVQRSVCLSPQSPLHRFSILWRISCGATRQTVGVLQACRCFSILWRISCGATRLPPVPALFCRVGFSILWRISCGATKI